MDIRIVLGAAATVIALLGYIPYFRNIILNRTKPHAFTWFVWSILVAIAFSGQVIDNAGPGAWVTGFTAIVCFLIFLLALVKGERNIVLVDWLSLAGAGVALLFWYITKGPLLSVIIITLIDLLGFFPTIRKSFMKPGEETATTYLLSGLKFVLAFFALENVSLITTLYPASLVITNWLFVAMLLIRRHQLKQSSLTPRNS